MIEVYQDNVRDQFPGAVKEFKQDRDTFLFKAENEVTLWIHVIRDSMIRFRYSVDGSFDNDFSYAIDENHSRGYGALDFEESTNFYSIHTDKLECRIDKSNLKVSIYDKNGILLNQDEKGFHWEEHPKYGGNVVKMSKRVQDAECFYGLGDKPTHLNLRGRRFENWGTDQYGFQKHTSPLYKNIPFYTGLHHGQAYGIFFDNSFKSFFDFAQERRGVTSFWAQGGEMNYYFIYGPELTRVTELYTNLTGRPEMPPLWALGYHQCKWSYYPESKVRQIADEFRSRDIPCDAIYLDIDYMDGFRCFTWDKEKFPEPKKMVDDLREQGYKTIVIIDPGIKLDKDYWVFQEALEKGYFCRRADGPYMKGKVWPGDCYFPDFTNPEARAWWADLYKELIGEIGIMGVWNDMNEPAIFEVESKTFPDDVRHDYDGNPCSHRKAHNVYGMQMARASYEGVKKYVYPNRPFIITRSAYSGAQRYTSTWSGDNVATWEHLSIANIQAQRSAVSGFSFIGSDIGGFTEHPTGELYARWIALGVFHILCRTHSSGDHGEQEPWSFGEEVEGIARKFIKLRYQILPYLYTTFWNYHKKGTPMIRPLSYFDQEDAETHHRTDEFLLGDHMLVCPIVEPNSKGRRMYIPRGNWYNYWTKERVEGGKEQWVDAELDIIPFFIKEGAVIPHNPVMNYVGEKKVETLELDVFFKLGKEKSTLFEDKGDGYDYQKGDYSLKEFKVLGTENSLEIYQHKSGGFTTEYGDYELNFFGLPFNVTSISVDGKTVSIDALKTNANQLRLPKDFNEIILQG
ncbi:MAG: glycoside hydrolase family 31 protein [Saprospiraceae bacterium]|nr:glycoside hydrolase family 31 protein [Saprospiraceae bacterium]